MTQNSKQKLILIHGWGMNSSAWNPIVESLAETYQLQFIDLPGHGKNRQQKAINLSEIVSTIIPEIEQVSHIIGWSLGGLVAQEIVRQRPDLIKKIALIASTPRFSQAENWHNAMPVDILNGFANNLRNDLIGTLKRFIALQFMGVKDAQAIQRELREDILKHLPDNEALSIGLDILLHSDFRDGNVDSDYLWLLGKKDRLIPVEVQDNLQVLYPTSKIEVIQGAGHAPFMTHPVEFVEIVTAFLN